MKISKKNERYLTWFFVILAVVIPVVYVMFYKRHYFEMFTNPPTLRYIYMQSCGHCKNFNPVWEELKTEVEKQSINIKLEKLDLQAEENKEKCEGISGAPTIVYIGTDDKSTEYKGERNVNEIINFLKNQTTKV